MDIDADTSGKGGGAGDENACPPASPLAARLPGFLALAAIPAAVLANPLFFGLAGGLLGLISLLLAPPGFRLPGVTGVPGSVAVLALARL